MRPDLRADGLDDRLLLLRPGDPDLALDRLGMVGGQNEMRDADLRRRERTRQAGQLPRHPSAHRVVSTFGLPLDTTILRRGLQDACVPRMRVGNREEEPAATHGHQDHSGLVDQTLPSVPLFMGEATHRILKEAAFWVSGLTRIPAGLLRHREPFEPGDFRITPFLNDHSAFDAYSLLVEADGRRLFYKSDIRGHGRKAAIFEQLLRQPPEDVDVLLTEGTNSATTPGCSRDGSSSIPRHRRTFAGCSSSASRLD